MTPRRRSDSPNPVESPPARRQPREHHGKATCVHVELSDDQEFFRETTHKFLAAESPLTSGARAGGPRRRIRRRATGGGGAELGWTSMLVPERDGGGSLSGAGLCDLALVAEEMGRLVAPGPLVPVSVVADAIARLGSEAQRGDVLGGIVSGETIGAWAFNEPGMRCDTDRIALTAELVDDGFVLVGDKSPIEAGGAGGRPRGHGPSGRRERGPDWPPRAVSRPGHRRRHHHLAARQPRSEPAIREHPVRPRRACRRRACSANQGPSDAEIERQLLIALVLQCAETCGAIAQVFEFTVEYLGDRFSFGRPLSSYQGPQASNRRHEDVARGLPRDHGRRRSCRERRERRRRHVGKRREGVRGPRSQRDRPGLRPTPRPASASRGSTICTSTSGG